MRPIWSFCLAWLTLCGVANAATLTLAWNPNAEPDIEGYVLDWGTQSGVYTTNSYVGNVTMKRGIFVKDNTFWAWYSQITMNTIKRIGVVVQLLDEKGAPTMTWTLTNAWPTKISSPTMKSDGNEVAIQTIEIAHEGLVIANS